MRTKIRTAPRGCAKAAKMAKTPAPPPQGLAVLAGLAVAPTPKPKTPFALLAEGMDSEYKSLRTQHPGAQKLLADAFAAAFAVACRVLDGER